MNVLMGVYNQYAPPKITPGGIVYFPHGLDDYGPRRILKKSIGRMVKQGVAPYIIAEFREWALRLPAELAVWIDQAYGQRMADWRRCVGGHLPDGTIISSSVLDRVTPSSFRIILHPAPFPVPQGVLTAGASWKDRIEVVAAYLSAGNTWLRRCDALIEWEIGNLIGIRHGFSPQNPDQEIGNKSPC